MNPALFKITLALSLVTFSVFSSAATIFQRSDFGPQAVEYGFDNAQVGDTTPGDGNLTVVGIISGRVEDSQEINFDDQGFTGPLGYATTIANGQQSGFNFLFDDPVSAVGFNFAVGALDQTKMVFALVDDNNQTIDFINVFGSDLDICTDTNLVDFRCGYIGLSAESNIVSRAELTPSFASVTFRPWHGDNIIYQKVPAPGIIWLIGLGFPGLLLARKKVKLAR